MNLKQRAIKSTVWFVGSRISVHALGWAVTIVIARFLSPRDYGLFAMGLPRDRKSVV